MRLGLWGARCEPRGLGYLTRAVHDHLQPDRTAVVDMGAHTAQFPSRWDWYPDATRVRYGEVDEQATRRWLRGLDVVWAAETFYDDRVPGWAAEEGVRSVVYTMPEFHRWPLPGLRGPDVVWNPTCWRQHVLSDARVVPLPVEVAPDRRLRTEPRFVHVAGHRAAKDRAGTRLLLAALRWVTTPAEVVIVTQDAHMPSPRYRHARLDVVLGGTDDRWDLYGLGDVMLAPRRYGGLSLPNHEAASSGLALVLPDVAPHRETWPGVYVPGKVHAFFATAGGMTDLFAVDVRALAGVIDGLVREPGRMADLSAASLAWAMAHSWDVLLPWWLNELDRAAG